MSKSEFERYVGDAFVRGGDPLVEKFTPPDAAAYGRFLAAAPDYRAV
ncbi:hypothetical protein [Bradyrhizobium australiense]|nr:hypothetical protein [Bradyrhizobium australiense]